jgi:hypothetical protein
MIDATPRFVTHRSNSPLPPETTPERVTVQVEAFCQKIAPDQTPVYLPVLPVSEAKPGECIYNVQSQVSANGGGMVLGWCIWERQGINLTAEFHAVWKSPDSELVDITPKPDGETKILFLHDPKLVWDGKRYPSHFTPLVQWREVTIWLAAVQRVQNLIQPGVNVIDDEFINANMQLKDASKKLEKRYLKNKS